MILISSQAGLLISRFSDAVSSTRFRRAAAARKNVGTWEFHGLKSVVTESTSEDGKKAYMGYVQDPIRGGWMNFPVETKISQDHFISLHHIGENKPTDDDPIESGRKGCESLAGQLAAEFKRKQPAV